jgi:predicted XRE-type DNA-binding protein
MLRELPLDPDKIQEALPLREVHKQVDIARFVALAPRQRAEETEPRDVMPIAELSQHLPVDLHLFNLASVRKGIKRRRTAPLHDRVQIMEQQGLSKSELARRMDTSRTQVERLLDPENDRVQLDTLVKAAHAVGRELKLELV